MRARARVKWAADNSPAAGLELPIVLVVAELGLLIAPVAGLGLPIVLAAELATQEPIDLAGEELAPSQPLAQPVGVAETALAIDKFPDLPVAEATMRSAELRVEIEVQRWPATTEVPPAWERPAAGAGTGAAAGAEGKQAIDKGGTNEIKIRYYESVENLFDRFRDRPFLLFRPCRVRSAEG